MVKKLRIRDKLLLTGAVLGDLFFEITKSPYIRIKEFEGVLPPGYGSTNFTGAVWRMLQAGFVDKVIKEGEPYLRLTGLGKRTLVRDFPLLSLRAKKWDGLWRMVFYDIAEKEKVLRSALQTKLKSVGFGKLQKSVYISPLPLSEELEEFIALRNLQERVFVGVCRRLLAGDDKQLAARVWRLDELNERYGEILIKIEESVQGGNKVTIDQLYHEFEQVLLDDPLLPQELLPEWWVGNEALRKMKELLRGKRDKIREI